MDLFRSKVVYATLIAFIIIFIIIFIDNYCRASCQSTSGLTEHLFPLRNDTTPRYQKLGGSSVELDPFEFEHFQASANHPVIKKEHCCGSSLSKGMEHCCGAKKAEHCICNSKMEHCCGSDKKEHFQYVPPADPKKCGGYIIPPEFFKPADDIYVGPPSKNSSSFLNGEHFENEGDVDRSWSSTIYTRSDEPHFNPTTPKPMFSNMKYLQNRGKYKCYDTCERKNDASSRSACMEECRILSSTVY